MPNAGDVIARALAGGLSRAVTTFMGREVVVTSPGAGIESEPLNLNARTDVAYTAAFCVLLLISSLGISRI